MPDVSFNEPQYRGSQRVSRNTKLESMVMRMGLAKDGQSAQRVLLVAAIVFGVLAVLVYIYFMPSPPPPDELDVNLP